jgi:hypothetical protein
MKDNEQRLQDLETVVGALVKGFDRAILELKRRLDEQDEKIRNQDKAIGRKFFNPPSGHMPN